MYFFNDLYINFGVVVIFFYYKSANSFDKCNIFTIYLSYQFTKIGENYE